ncbi:MAG: hypothetical protein E6J34_16230 [Chloroflexi bacterium]|nr:MAG: hypothetical protein E6J34_16230 [Chloroflexota bacterium]
MANTVLSEKLQELINKYADDKSYQKESLVIESKRAETLPKLQTVVRDFVEERATLRMLRDEVGPIVRAAKVWGAQGKFLMEMNKLVKNHDEHAPIAENMLRQVLHDISVQNMGQKIEQFYRLLQMSVYGSGAKERMRRVPCFPATRLY